MSRKPGLHKASRINDASTDNVIRFPARAEALSSPQEDNPLLREMNPRELSSIDAITSYISYNQNVREETVRAFVEAEFGVNDIAEIKRKEYERVITFLVDLRIDLLTN